MHFARVLRRAGLPVGPDRVMDALRAIEITGVERRDDFYWTLASLFISRQEHFELFDQAFHIFWRNAQMLDRVMAMTLPRLGQKDPEPQRLLANRLVEAMAPRSRVAHPAEEPPQDTPDATYTVSERERLQKADFDGMSATELQEAKRLIASLRLPLPEVRTRRLRPSPREGRVDLRDTLRASLRGSADIIALRRRAPQRRPPPLVILCDISGSMSRYSRMFLHFVHAITSDRHRVHTFLFGTRLTNVTRHLRHADVDMALNAVVGAVEDWSGGTRIGTNLQEFNLRWSRRVLGQNAVVLLISDGLDRESGDDLALAMGQLHRSCHRLLWLNPLLRSAQFQPLAKGVRLMLPHVDEFLPVHNVSSLTGLAQALALGRAVRRRAPHL